MSTLSRRHFMSGALAGAGLLAVAGRPRHSRAAAPGTAKNVILLVASGGWDVTYALDPKPGLATVDVPAGTLSMYGDLPIWTDPSRPGVAAFFAAHAAVTAVVNGIYVRSIAHPECMKRMLTGTPSSSNPDLAAIAAHETGRDLPLPYLILGNSAFTGPLAASAGRAGSRNQLVTLLDPAQAWPPPVGVAASRFTPDAADEAAIRAFVDAGAERERAVRGAHGYNRRRLDDFATSLQRGDLLRGEAAGFGQRGRALSLTQQMDLAVDVLEQGIARATMLDTRILWDTHDGNDDQNAYFDTTFRALKGLIDDLTARDMLDDTIVAVMSEMSRTPKLNGDAGKDHWPVTSAMIIGGGVRGGRAYGGSTDELNAALVDLATGERDSSAPGTIQTDNLVAGVLTLAGVDPEPWFPGVEALGGFRV